MNRARPMAARLINKNKPRVDYEPRSAHGRAVKKNRGAVVNRSLKKRGLSVTLLNLVARVSHLTVLGTRLDSPALQQIYEKRSI